MELLPCDVRDFIQTDLSDNALSRLIAVVQDKIGSCVEANYSDAVAQQIMIYAVGHMVETQAGNVTQDRAANGSSISTNYATMGSGIKSTTSGKLLHDLDSARCYLSLFTVTTLFCTVGSSNK